MGVSVQTGGEGKKPLDAELNLIPFIDLLVCCICFLLITAVWTQLAHVEVQQKLDGPSVSAESRPHQDRVSVLVGDEGYAVVVGSLRQVIAKKGLVYDTTALSAALHKVRSSVPQRSDLSVAVEDGVPYMHVVRTLDIARQARFEKISVKDAAQM